MATSPALLTGGESRIGLALTRGLGRAGIPVAVLSSNPAAPAFWSRYCTQRRVTPPMERTDDYLEELARLVRSSAYSAMVFADEGTALAVGRERQHFLPHVPLLLPPQESLEILMDRERLAARLAGTEVAIPRSMRVADETSLCTALDCIRAPWVLRAAKSSGNEGVRFAADADEARRALAVLSSPASTDGTEITLSAFITGECCSVMGLCDHGVPLRLVIIRKRETWPAKGGIVVEAETMDDPGLRHAYREVSGLLAWHGMLELEFIRCEQTGQWILIEGSPEPNWGVDLAIKAGVNLPGLAWHMMQGQPIPADTPLARPYMRYLWTMPRLVKAVLRRPWALGRLRQRLRDCGQSDLGEGDLLPYAVQLCNFPLRHGLTALQSLRARHP